MTDRERKALLTDPFGLQKLLWPDVRFYDKQREIILSVERNARTFVPAANKVGKDFVAGYVAISQFLRRREVRIVTTSVKDDHLRVLWGEIGRYVDTAKYPLAVDKGGPLIVNFRDLRKMTGPAGDRKMCQISYLRGMVSERGEGMAGHHAEWTLGIIDEASGVDDLVYTQMETWASRVLAFGNPNPCENFFRRAVEDGDLLASDAMKHGGRPESVT